MENKIVENILSFLEEAGKVALEFQSTKCNAKYKEDSSIVTEADISISKIFRERIKKFFNFADYVILDEENLINQEDIFKNNSEYLWIIDPIDGTNTYFHGLPMWAIGAALYRNLEPYISFIYLPAMAEILYTDSHKSYLIKNAFLENSVQTQQSASREILTSKSIILQHKLTNFNNTKYSILDFYSSYVSAFYTLTNRSIASFFNKPAKLWDIAATLPIVKNLGLSFRNIASNRELKKFSGNIVDKDWSLRDTYLLCNSEYYSKILEIF